MRLLTTLVAIVLFAAPTPVRTQPRQPTRLTCLDFHLTLDGSWRAYHPLTINGVKIDPRVAFHPGDTLFGVDLASMLNAKCR